MSAWKRDMCSISKRPDCRSRESACPRPCTSGTGPPHTRGDSGQRFPPMDKLTGEWDQKHTSPVQIVPGLPVKTGRRDAFPHS